MQERLDAALRLAALDTDAFVAAVLDQHPDVLVATGRFTEPSGPDDVDALARLQSETEAAITLLERRLAAIGAELDALPRPGTPAAETGTRIDVAG
jgi:hypothetical protein